MSTEQHAIARLRVDTESSFAAGMTTSTMGNFRDIPAIEGSIEMSLMEEMLNPETIQQHLDGYPSQQATLQSCSLTFSMNLGSPGNYGNGQTAVQGPLGELLASCMGVENLMMGDLAEATNTGTATFEVGSGAAATNNMVPGAAIGISRGPSSQQAVREIQDVTADVVTLKLALDQSTAENDSIRACATYALAQDPSGSLQFVVEGAEQEDCWVLFGCQLESMALELPVGGLPRITFTFQGAKWSQADGVGSSYDGTGTAIGLASISNHNLMHFEGEVIYGQAGVESLASATKLPLSELVIEPQITYQPVRTPGGTNTIARYRRSRTAPAVTGSFVIPYDDDTYLDERTAEATHFLFAQIGTVAGSIAMISLPSIQVTNVERIEADGGISSQRISFSAQTDADTTGTADIAESPFRIHLA